VLAEIDLARHRRVEQHVLPLDAVRKGRAREGGIDVVVEPEGGARPQRGAQRAHREAQCRRRPVLEVAGLDIRRQIARAPVRQFDPRALGDLQRGRKLPAVERARERSRGPGAVVFEAYRIGGGQRDGSEAEASSDGEPVRREVRRVSQRDEVVVVIRCELPRGRPVGVADRTAHRAEVVIGELGLGSVEARGADEHPADRLPHQRSRQRSHSVGAGRFARGRQRHVAVVSRLGDQRDRQRVAAAGLAQQAIGVLPHQRGPLRHVLKEAIRLGLLAAPLRDEPEEEAEQQRLGGAVLLQLVEADAFEHRRPRRGAFSADLLEQPDGGGPIARLHQLARPLEAVVLRAASCQKAAPRGGVRRVEPQRLAERLQCRGPSLLALANFDVSPGGVRIRRRRRLGRGARIGRRQEESEGDHFIRASSASASAA